MLTTRKHADNAVQPFDTVARVDGILDRAIRTGASDVHVEPMDAAVRIRFRVDGLLHDMEDLPLGVLPNIVTRLKVMAGLLTYRVDVPQEGSLSIQSGDSWDIRISTFPTIRGERVTVRFLPQAHAVRSLEQLGLSDSVRNDMARGADSGQGLILVVGPAGSGKTTTLYALLRRLLESRPGTSFLTLEDPVEYRLDGVAQIQVAPHGELTYARALRSLVRQDPQVILIGEIRDPQTAHIAIEAALTGHLILSTLHGGSPPEAVVRLREMGVAPYQLTSALRLIVSQRLLRTVCAECVSLGAPIADCPHCLGSGYRGRTACAETASMFDDLRKAILDGADAADMQGILRARSGFVGLAEDARRHLESGRTTPDEAATASRGGS